MRSLKQLVPEADAILRMHPADLAGYLFEALCSLRPDDRSMWNRRNFCLQVSRDFGSYEVGRRVAEACAEAWSWLEVNGLICRDPEQDNDWYIPTRRGKEVRNHTAVRQVISSEQLPEQFLHREFVVNVRPLFLQGRFETAVFEAFKSLEVAIRAAAGLGHDAIGVALASQAFHPENGVLTDTSLERGERVALMNLMTGAIGSYKNPSSHRRVALSADEARDMIILASHLLKIVEMRSARRSQDVAAVSNS